MLSFDFFYRVLQWCGIFYLSPAPTQTYQEEILESELEIQRKDTTISRKRLLGAES